ncbi:hypothetical protein SJ05684_c10670 [Sinorhizobium sojae CCBAU 05684]|uniref:Uncharacterized protein n=1 Tax=Sinorhizobium sojae CCBAU 05684 TaxID=716928 RepID=A0A249PA26_9HYPH|nr:hypothetical protein [Sinorhizobium sojae]ASY62524.1 hypothetical protein SJ05684_c10670 [Sinorhizobium sojae CCBAU 05684]
MTTTVAAIAEEVFDAVAEELSDVILSCTVTHKTQGAYDATTGAYSETTSTYTGRALICTGATVEGVGGAKITDIFPGYVAGPADVVMILEGLTGDPKENDTIAAGGVTRTIKAVGDVVGAGSFFIVIAA